MVGHDRRPSWSWELAKRLVVCTLLLWGISLVSGDECGTRFTDPASSTVLAEVVIQGMIDESHDIHPHNGVNRMNVTIGKVYKGMDVLKDAGLDQKVMVGNFGEENKDRCVASMGDMGNNSMHIFFLRRTSDRDTMQLSALPLQMEGKIERRVRRSLCDTCVRPPHIRKITCKDCAREPKIRDMKSRQVKLGKRGRLRCAASGRPSPVFSWFKNGVPVTSGSGGVTIRNTATVSILVFQRATTAHKGQYTCVATNQVGKSEKVVTLDVVRPKSVPKYTVENAPDRVVCQENPCLNGGTCYYSAILDLRHCLCTEKYEGVKCENNVTSSQSTSVRNRQRPSNRGTGRKISIKNSEEPVEGEEKENVQQQPASSLQGQNSSSIDTRNTVEEIIHTDDVILISSTTTVHPSDRTEPDLETNSTIIRKTTSVEVLSQVSTTYSPPGRSGASNGSVSSPTHTRSSFPKDKNRGGTDGRNRNYGAIDRISNPSKSYLKIVYCKEKRYCQNGGRCRLVRKLNVKFCKCPSGFAGMRCEIKL